MKDSMILDEEFTLLEKIILVLLYVRGRTPIVGKVRLQKLIFLISQDLKELRNELDFEAYKYGMYDQTIEDILEGLELDGFIVVDENNEVKLTSKGVEKAEMLLKSFTEREIKTIEEVKELFEGLSEDEILALLYSKFPEFSKYSEKLREINRKRKELAISLYP